jgi:hypothetical protein
MQVLVAGADDWLDFPNGNTFGVRANGTLMLLEYNHEDETPCRSRSFLTAPGWI